MLSVIACLSSLEPDVEYDVLVQIIDATRSYPEVVAGDVIYGELFPEVSIGDAPVLAGN